MSSARVFPRRTTPCWLTGRDPRLLVLAAVGFAFVTVSLNRLPVLIVAFASAVLVAAWGLRDARTIFRPLVSLGGIILVMLLTLPFTVPGEPWLEIGPLRASLNGLELVSRIALKASAVALALVTLLGGIDPAALGHALARLGIPDKLAHLFLLTVRYVGVLYQEHQRLHRAMRARAFVPRSDRHTWRSLGWLMGMLLVRSLERSRRVSAAMKCRGFYGRLHLLDPLCWRPADSLLGLLFLLGFAGLLALEHLP